MFEHPHKFFDRLLDRLLDQQPMTPEKLQRHMYKTYITLRGGLCGLALAFPFLLLGVGYLNHMQLQDSMSEYYFAFEPHGSDDRIFPGRVVFVGMLFALGVGLILYKGFSKLEDGLLNIAGGAALIAALIPMQAPEYCKNCGSKDFSIWHVGAGAVVFTCLALVAWFCTGKTLRNLPESWKRWEGWFRTGYFVLGAVMLGFLIATILRVIYDKSLFLVEASLLVTFALYWALRSLELWASKLELNAMTGKKQPEEKPSTGILPVPELPK